MINYFFINRIKILFTLIPDYANPDTRLLTPDQTGYTVPVNEKQIIIIEIIQFLKINDQKLNDLMIEEVI